MWIEKRTKMFPEYVHPIPFLPHKTEKEIEFLSLTTARSPLITIKTPWSLSSSWFSILVSTPQKFPFLFVFLFHLISHHLYLIPPIQPQNGSRSFFSRQGHPSRPHAWIISFSFLSCSHSPLFGTHPQSPWPALRSLLTPPFPTPPSVPSPSPRRSSLLPSRTPSDTSPRSITPSSERSSPRSSRPTVTSTCTDSAPPTTKWRPIPSPATPPSAVRPPPSSSWSWTTSTRELLSSPMSSSPTEATVPSSPTGLSTTSSWSTPARWPTSRPSPCTLVTPWASSPPTVTLPDSSSPTVWSSPTTPPRTCTRRCTPRALPCMSRSPLLMPSYGQMTAGSYMYIGPQGIVHGTTITILNAGRYDPRPSLHL